MLKHTFEPVTWAAVPFHFWSVVFFVFGSMIGSFLNVCIHRLPLNQSVVSPPSHCPHCNYSIPWYLNIPLVTWVYLRGRCRNCAAPISARYFLVEILTGITFLGTWLAFGHWSAGVALVYSLLLAGLIAATFIDFEHFIIPDEITIGGMGAGFICSFLVPRLHHTNSIIESMQASALGLAVGGGLIYAILRLGKLFFGRQKMTLPTGTKIVFTENGLRLPDKEILYGDLFYRKSDVIVLRAKTVELADRCYKDALVRLSPASLRIDEEKLNPEQVPYLEAVSEEITLPREAMGFGDVKFMAAIGAFLGWHAVIFSLMVSSIIGSVVGVGLILIRRQAWSARLPYGPYIAMAAAIWVFSSQRIAGLIQWWLRLMGAPGH
jgi:leader peptidase (prepilin peptidase)/N-methyltransferase